MRAAPWTEGKNDEYEHGQQILHLFQCKLILTDILPTFINAYIPNNSWHALHGSLN